MGDQQSKPLQHEWRYTCRRHRDAFNDIMREFGIENEYMRSVIRYEFMVEVMQTYPGGFTEYNAKRQQGIESGCMGCFAERIGCYRRAAKSVRNLANKHKRAGVT